MLVGGVVALLLCEAIRPRQPEEEAKWTELEQKYEQFVKKLNRLPLPRIELRNRAIGLVDNALLIATMYLALLLIGLYYEPVSPGRPTLPLRQPNIGVAYIVLYALLFGLWVILTRQKWSIMLLLVSSVFLVLLHPAFIAIILFSTSLYLSWRSYNLQLSLLTVLLVSITFGIALRQSPTMNQSYGWIAWSPWVSSTIIGIAVGLASLVAYLATKPQGSKQLGLGDNLAPHNLSKKYTVASTRFAKLHWLLMLTPLLLAVLSVLIPHILYGFNKIISLDTVFNIKWLSLLRQGEYEVLVSSQRPLYILTVHLPALLLEVDPITYFDIVVPLVGLSALAISVFYIYPEKPLGNKPSWSILSSVLAIAYWAPYFIYAGLQTNLLILPLALYFVKLVYSSLKNYKTSLAKLVSISVVLGLWHPWTLAYVSLSIILLLLKTQVERNYTRLEKYPRLKLLLYSLVPGWLSHIAIALIARSSGVVNVAYSLISTETSLLWSIKIFMWGTGMRPEYYLLSAIIPLLYLLDSRKLEVRNSSTLTPWVTALTLPAFLGLLLPQTKHLLRLYINAPFPLLVTDVLRHTKQKKTTILVTVLVVILTWIYFIVFAVSPERVTPIKE